MDKNGIQNLGWGDFFFPPENGGFSIMEGRRKKTMDVAADNFEEVQI